VAAKITFETLFAGTVSFDFVFPAFVDIVTMVEGLVAMEDFRQTAEEEM
jgi:hypothetical protein